MHGPAHRHALVKAPVAARSPRIAHWHGVELVDDYAWLKADNWQEVMRDPAVLDPEIRAYLEAENAFSEAQLSDTGLLQDALFTEMKGRLKENDSTVPAPDGPFAYSSSFVAGGQYPLLCRRPRAGGSESVLLDGNVEAKGKAYWDIGGAQHSPDHKLLAYASDDRGSELYTIRIRDLATGQDLADCIPDTRGGFVWANDSKTLFYVRLDEHHRPLLVYRHVVGTPVEADVLVYEEKDIGFYVALSGTQSSKYILIDAHTHQTSELYLIDADAPLQAPAHRGAAQIWSRVRCRAPRGPAHHHDELRQGRRISASARRPLAAPGMANWREVIPHRPGCLILDTILYRDHMVRLEREEGLPRIVIRRLADGAEHTISFPEEAYALGVSSGYEFDTTTLRFVYSSMTTPAETYDYDMEARTRTLRKRQEVPSGHNPDDYVTRRLYAPAPDGETVPISILYRKDTRPRRLGAGLSLRLRGLRDLDSRLLLDDAPVARRPRLHLRHRPHPRRQGQGLSLVHGRQARQEGQHLHRLHRGGRIPGRARSHAARTHRGQRRLGRRHADGRRRQHGARPLPRHHRRRALRRRVEHHARQGPAADAARMARVGQSDCRARRTSTPSAATAPMRT